MKWPSLKLSGWTSELSKSAGAVVLAGSAANGATAQIVYQKTLYRLSGFVGQGVGYGAGEAFDEDGGVGGAGEGEAERQLLAGGVEVIRG